MRLAYLILAHKNPGQLQRLASRLSNPCADIFIHLDRKTEEEASYFALSSLLQNVFFISRRVSVKWGAFSMVQATLNGLAEILEHGAYDYISLLSGQDYPIKSNEEIMSFFTRYYGREFLHFRQNPSCELPQGGSDRFEYYYDYDNEVTNRNEYELEMKERGMKRAYIAGMKAYHGSQWWSLTGGCIGGLLEEMSKNRELVNYYRYTKFPDEQFFQTLVMNSRFACNAINNNLRYIDWSHIDWPSIDWIHSVPHPKTLTERDIGKLKGSGRLFARKFDGTGAVLDSIDRMLLKKGKPGGDFPCIHTGLPAMKAYPS